MAINLPRVYIEGASATGSFSKLIVSGSPAQLDIAFGQLTEPESEGTYSVHDGVHLNSDSGMHIDGPIARFKVVKGGVIAYKITH